MDIVYFESAFRVNICSALNDLLQVLLLELRAISPNFGQQNMSTYDNTIRFLATYSRLSSLVISHTLFCYVGTRPLRIIVHSQ